MRANISHPGRKLLIDIIEEAYHRRAWHGPNLRGSIRGLSAKQAAWRPAGRRHNIWEIVIHTAYWKYAVRRRLTGEKKGSFPLKGSNWFPRPVRFPERAWREDVSLLENEHKKMHDAVQTMLSNPPVNAATKKGKKLFSMIYGIALHDIYHAGQIQLLKRLLKNKK